MRQDRVSFDSPAESALTYLRAVSLDLHSGDSYGYHRSLQAGAIRLLAYGHRSIPLREMRVRLTATAQL